MTDFISELEAELVDAARRRARRGRFRWQVPRVMPMVATAAAVVMIVAAVGAALSIDRTRTGDERPAPVGGDCAPSRAMLEAVPALAGPASVDPPATVAAAMAAAGAGPGWRHYARLATFEGDVRVWVVPNLPCYNAREREERVCIVLEDRGMTCHPPADIRARGTWRTFESDGRTGVAGLAPAGNLVVGVHVDGAEALLPRIAGGVFGGILPAGTRADRVEVRFLDGPPVTVLDATGIDGLATEVGDRLPGEEGVRIGTFAEQDRERSTVYYAYDEARPGAEHVAGLLRIYDVQRAPSEVLERADLAATGAGDSGVIVVVGADLAHVRQEDVGLLEATDQPEPEAIARVQERILPGAAMSVVRTGERRARSSVQYAPGWQRPAREVMRALDLDVGEQAGELTPEPALGTPIVVVVGDDLR
jgi:LytR cell envelope-related transcriptional attenuator